MRRRAFPRDLAKGGSGGLVPRTLQMIMLNHLSCRFPEHGPGFMACSFGSRVSPEHRRELVDSLGVGQRRDDGP